MSLKSEYSQAQTAYEPSLWAKMFHAVPHMNITFHQVNSRFDPENDLYLESLGILASIPAAWLITTLVVLLIYLLTRCCDTKNNRKRKSRPIRCCLSFFSLVCCATLSGGFWGNHKFHEGIVEFGKATLNINNVISRAQEMASSYNNILQRDIEKNLNRLYDGPFQRDISESAAAHFEIMDSADLIFYNISQGLKAMDEIRFSFDDGVNKRIDFRHVPAWATTTEKYRWPTTMALQSLFALFCLLLFVGAIVHSRCVLILFSVFGLFSIILLFLLSSVYITTAVALADFCYDPTPWVEHIIKDSVPRDISSYYLECGQNKQSPFAQAVGGSQRAVTDIDMRVRKISKTARQYYPPGELDPHLENLEQSSQKMIQLVGDFNSALKCDPIFRSYNTALVSICDSSLFGLILMLISAAASGFLFTVLVWCNSHTWIYFKHKGRYIKVDDQDPYMPLSTIERPRHMAPAGAASGPYHHRRNIHTPPQTPPYHGMEGQLVPGNGSFSQTKTPTGILRIKSRETSTLNGHGTLGGGSVTAYGHIGGLTSHQHTPSATLQSRQMTAAAQNNHMIGTLGRNATTHSQGYHAMSTLPSTMTLGRRGHYASLRNHPRLTGAADDGPLGPNQGQYATLSKQCKTLESSDFY